MDINCLSGSALDEYGESIGVYRYVGFSSKDTDEEYREAIRNSGKLSRDDGPAIIPDEPGEEWYRFGKLS